MPNSQIVILPQEGSSIKLYLSVEQKTITIQNGKEKETYSLVSSPSISSPMVQSAKHSILHELELNTVLTNLQLSSDLIYVAYCALAGTQIQSKISNLEYKLLRLCEKASISAGIMNNNTQSIITSISSAYRYLLGGKMGHVEKYLKACSLYAMKMAEESKVISDQFSALADQSEMILEDSQNMENLKDEEIRNIQEKRKEYIIKQKVEKEKFEALISEEEQVEALYQEAKETEKEQSKKALILGIISSITGSIGAGVGMATNVYMAQSNMQMRQQPYMPTGQQPMMGQQPYAPMGQQPMMGQQPYAPMGQQVPPYAQQSAQIAAGAGSQKAFENISSSTSQMGQQANSTQQKVATERQILQQKKIDLMKQRRETLVAMKELALSVEHLKDSENHAATAVKMMHLAVICLKKISVSLSNASMFWMSMSNYCNNLSIKDISLEAQDLTELLANQDELTLYSMYVCLTYLAEWTALNDVCHDYLLASEAVQKKVGYYIEQAPDIAQALTQAPQLAEKLRAHINDEITYIDKL